MMKGFSVLLHSVPRELRWGSPPPDGAACISGCFKSGTRS